MKLDYIHDLIDTDNYYLYYKNKLLLSANTMKKLKEQIKEEINEPSKDIKVFVISFGIYEQSTKPFRITCSQFTLTPRLSLVVKSDDMSQIITYSKDDKFKLSHIVKIIKAIKDDKISFEKASVPISDV